MDTKHLRNPFASHAHCRKAGAMRHRCAPRGGSRNEQADILAEALDESIPTHPEE